MPLKEDKSLLRGTRGLLSVPLNAGQSLTRVVSRDAHKGSPRALELLDQ